MVDRESNKEKHEQNGRQCGREERAEHERTAAMFEQQGTDRWRYGLRDEARGRRPAHDRSVAARVEQDEGQRTPRDGVDPVASAVEDQGQRGDGPSAEEQPGAEREQRHGCDHGPERMVMPAYQHFDHAGADLRRADQCAETDGDGQVDTA